jgi:hypothetical protein
MDQFSRLIYVEMKTRRAQEHFTALQAELDKWLENPKKYTVREYTDFDHGVHIVRVEIGYISKAIPVLVGDFVHNLRSALDNLAWELAHLPPKRVFTEAGERHINFPIFKRRDDPTYVSRRSLFPSAVAEIFDSFQPYKRGDAFRDDPLWQLNELWTLDKHRAIPMNSNSVNLNFPGTEWQRYFREIDYGAEVHFPILMYYASKVHLKPTVSVEILFGEHMGDFVISRARLGEINDFVRKDVIPRFMCFFPEAPDSLKGIA